MSKNNKFQVSADADNPTNTGVRFSNINGQYDDIFATFSPEKLFTPIGANLMGIRFFGAGHEYRGHRQGSSARSSPTSTVAAPPSSSS